MENTSPVHNTPRDTFLYLLALVTLIASAVSFGLLVYQFIELKFPDALSNVYYYTTSANYTAMRSALATLVIVFPVFFWVSRFLHKDVEGNPEKRNLKIRRWLMYLTVFAAGLVVIGDLIALVYNFLQGDLTTRFILKVLTVLFIAGSSLWYYLAELRNKAYPRALFQGVIIAVVGLAVVYGFWTAGSPQHQRLLRLDDQKIGNLQTIQSQIVYSYWQQKGSIPSELSQLNDPISGFTIPADPQSGQSYEYHATGTKSFQLCAVFNEPSSQTVAAPVYDPSNNWQHDKGRTCFDRTIDSTLYPVRPVTK